MVILKAGIFDIPQIRTLLKDTVFLNNLTQIESEALLCLFLVVNHFWVNDKAPDLFRIGC